MKILIVDDSTFMRGILKDIVAKSNWNGSQVFEAADGDQALALYNTEKPDMVLLDIIMPNKDGMEVLKNIGHSSTAVVMISSMEQEHIIQEAKTLGAKDYIVKPFDVRQVIKVLNEFKPA